jgi:hypothetical protein
LSFYARTHAREQMAAAFAKAGKEGIRRMAIDVSHARAARPSEHFAQTIEPRLPRRLLDRSALLMRRHADSSSDLAAAAI